MNISSAISCFSDSVAQELGSKKDLIKKVVEWSTADHPGVQGEASRFLAWLIKNCRFVIYAILIYFLYRLSYMFYVVHDVCLKVSLVASLYVFQMYHSSSCAPNVRVFLRSVVVNEHGFLYVPAGTKLLLMP